MMAYDRMSELSEEIRKLRELIEFLPNETEEPPVDYDECLEKARRYDWLKKWMVRSYGFWYVDMILEADGPVDLDTAIDIQMQKEKE